jgi:hypothetical protein
MNFMTSRPPPLDVERHVAAQRPAVARKQIVARDNTDVEAATVTLTAVFVLI